MVRLVEIESLYFSPVRHKIERARKLFAIHGGHLRHQVIGTRRLAHLLRLADAVTAEMAALGLHARCAACGQQPAGGCCSAQMADEADTLLLLQNLLVGHSVDPHAPAGHGTDEGECCFLGPRGCSLALKPFFCLSYLCSEIRSRSRPESLRALAQHTAALQREQVAVEQTLLGALAEGLTAAPIPPGLPEPVHGDSG